MLRLRDAIQETLDGLLQVRRHGPFDTKEASVGAPHSIAFRLLAAWTLRGMPPECYPRFISLTFCRCASTAASWRSLISGEILCSCGSFFSNISKRPIIKEIEMLIDRQRVHEHCREMIQLRGKVAGHRSVNNPQVDIDELEAEARGACRYRYFLFREM